MADDILNGAAQSQLRSIVERAERLEAEKAEIAEHLKEVFAEAKANGYCTKTLRKVIRLRKIDRAKRQEEDAILDTYLAALGELPLFKAAEPTSSVTITRENAAVGLGVLESGGDAVGVGEDPYPRAKMIVLRDGKASTSYIQRRMQIGYNLAASLIERMEAEGMVSRANAAGKREILVQEAA